MAGFVTRFAPSPTGPLHLGHAFSALLAHDMARAAGGKFLLRLEDIDLSRSKAEWEHQLIEDLTWLGISWDGPVLRQSARMACYQTALDGLWARGLLYRCDCSRRDIEHALSAPQEGVELPIGPDGLVYPGTCRKKRPLQDAARPRPKDQVLRLNMPRTLEKCFSDSEMLAFQETGRDAPFWVKTDRATYVEGVGDVVLARRDMGTSYHLSVVLDDAAQGVTHVIRGQDLFEATRIHRLLQCLLDLPTPIYHHHRLIRDEDGKRLAKRDDARALTKFRTEGATPADIRRLVGL